MAPRRVDRKYNGSINRRENVLEVDLWYPRVEDNIDTIQVMLMDVRAADDIQISYDFERDGWVIKQASKFVWDADDEICDPDWQEVAFIAAWAREDPSR